MPDNEYPYCEFCGAGEDDCRCDNGGCLAGLVDGCLSVLAVVTSLSGLMLLLLTAAIRGR